MCAHENYSEIFCGFQEIPRGVPDLSKGYLAYQRSQGSVLGWPLQGPGRGRRLHPGDKDAPAHPPSPTSAAGADFWEGRGTSPVSRLPQGAKAGLLPLLGPPLGPHPRPFSLPLVLTCPSLLALAYAGDLGGEEEPPRAAGLGSTGLIPRAMRPYGPLSHPAPILGELAELGAWCLSSPQPVAEQGGALRRPCSPRTAATCPPALPSRPRGGPRAGCQRLTVYLCLRRPTFFPEAPVCASQPRCREHVGLPFRSSGLASRSRCKSEDISPEDQGPQQQEEARPFSHGLSPCAARCPRVGPWGWTLLPAVCPWAALRGP